MQLRCPFCLSEQHPMVMGGEVRGCYSPPQLPVEEDEPKASLWLSSPRVMRPSTVTVVAPLISLPSITPPCHAGRLLVTQYARALVLTVLHFSLVIFPSVSLHVAQRKEEKDVLSAYAVPGTTVLNSMFRLGLTGKVTLTKRPERVRDFAL